MTQNIQEVFLPPNISAITGLKKTALLSGFLTIVCSIIMMLVSSADVYITLACISGSILISFHLLRKPGKFLTLPQKIAGMGVSFLVGLFAILHVLKFPFQDLYSVTLFCIVLSIFLLSVSIPHRHHFSHLFSFAAVMLSAFQFFSVMYGVLVGIISISASYQGFSISILLLLFSQTILLCKPDRGFIGMMTTNTTSSKVSLHFFFYFIIIGPLVSLLVLLGAGTGIYSYETILPLLVSLLTGFSIIMNWLNAKFLYKLELEKHLITEILRVNNIHLETKSEDLKTQIANLEQEKEDIRDKFDHRNRLKDIISSQG